MELKVMILDDEYIILDGLCSFPWADYGCTVTGVAKNGLEGMEKLDEAAPDLIFSDVKMPGMDGLEFSAHAKEKYPDVTIVILTGYDSFSYAQQSIRIGVEEYLLKPIDYDEMKETVRRLTAEIREKKVQKEEVLNLQQYFNHSLPKLRSRFVENLLYGRIQGKKEMQAQEKSLQIHIEKYLVCVGRKTGSANTMDACDQWIEEFACINIYEEIFHNFHIQVLSDYNTATGEYNFILQYSHEESEESCMDRAINACQKIQEVMEKYLHVAMNFGLSDLSEDDYEASDQYRKAQIACRQCIYLGTNIILKYEDLNLDTTRDFALTTGEKNRFMMGLFQEDFAKADTELKRIFSHAPANTETVKFAAMDLLISCMKFPYTCAVESCIQNKNWNVLAFQDGIRKIAECENTEDIVNCLLTIFRIVIRQNAEGSDERNLKFVHRIQDYIEQNYANDLSMDDLTQEFHVSKTYISRLLKKYSGQSFLEYLTDVRFRHVEQLIRENKHKQYEIAEMVGYRDFGYYIKVFKKRYGITPNEFRRRI